MLVSRRKLEEVVECLTPGTYSVDVEATGLRPYHGDRLFSLIICNGKTSWYFNFQEYPTLDPDWVLPREETFSRLAPFFSEPENYLYLHNAKFDMSMLALEGVTDIAGTVYDTEVLGRLLYNRHMKYSLAESVKRIGLKKSTEVEDHIAKNKLFTWVQSPGKAKRAKWPHFDQVPFEIISRYGETDGFITWQLGEHLFSEMTKLSDTLTKSRAYTPLRELASVEAQVTKTCFAMEQVGIRIDRDYCQKAYDYETSKASEVAAKFEEIAGVPLVDSGKALSNAFDAVGEKYPLTEKGNPSFTDAVLEGFTSPLARILQDHRAASKRANTYFANFLYFADSEDRIHPNMKQAGTDTGRFSYSDPNLQNVPKEDEGEFPVRRAFIPTDEDHLLVAIDYDQMEYRLLLEYAHEKEIIRKILEDGLDVHQATADSMGVERTSAKTLNFGLLYGMGAEKLAKALNIPVKEAKELKQKYFQKLPGVQAFSRGVADRAEGRGFVFNWAGRVCFFPRLKNPKTGRLDRFAYRAPNHVIQGGCADVVKIAMPRCHDILKGCKSRMLLQVHDELLFEVHRSETELVPQLKTIMEGAYPHKYLPLTCSVEYSAKSWADKKPWGEFSSSPLDRDGPEKMAQMR